MPPSWLPPQHLSYRIAQSVQGPSPRFLSGPSLVCTHAVLRPRRLSNKRGCLELGRAIHCFRHFHIIRGVGVPHTSFPPRIHTTKCPLLTCTTCPRHPAQRACLKNLNGSFGPLPPRALWRPVETEHSPDSGGPISPRLGRAAAELDHPQGWQLSSSMWLHTQKELGSPRLAFRVRYISPSPGFTSDSLLYTSHPLNTHL